MAFKIPDDWIQRAEVLAQALSGIATVTKTEVLRHALSRGLDILEEETKKRPRKR